MRIIVSMLAWLIVVAPGYAQVEVEKLYNTVNQPMYVRLVVPNAVPRARLVLMDYDGQLLADPQELLEGRYDLRELFPVIPTLREAAYLQCFVNEAPMGPAHVLQPMLSRYVPIVEQAQRNVNGAYVQYSKIVGWWDESQETPPTDGAGNSNRDTDTNTNSDSSSTPDGAAPDAGTSAPGASDTRIFNGLQIFPEQDLVLHTTHGDITVVLRHDVAPQTAWNFFTLAANGFYDGLIFHRIVPFTRMGKPFVIQAGDPTASGGPDDTGDGGPGYWVPMERSDLAHDFGVLSMARADNPDSAGSQFFICLSRDGTARLDGQYCAFGYAVEGAAAIKAISGVELADPRGRPVTPPVIESVEVVAAPARQPGVGRPDERVLDIPDDLPVSEPRIGR